jgi:methyl-accepting chemotaxis protein
LESYVRQDYTLTDEGGLLLASVISQKFAAALGEQGDDGTRVAHGAESIAKMADANFSAVAEIAEPTERLVKLANWL